MNIIETDWKWKTTLSARASTKYIALHHAAAVTCTAQQIDEWHKSNGWSGIGYHFFVRKDGTVYRGRPIDKMGAHVQGRNSDSVGICAEGNYDTETTMPAAQKNALKELIGELKQKYPNAAVVGHKEIGSSDCPGKYYPLDELKDEEEIDMEELMKLSAQTAALNAQVSALAAKTDETSSDIQTLKAQNEKMIYDYIDDNMPEWARESVRFCLDKGIIKGTGDGKLGLDDKDLKICAVAQRIMTAVG